MLRFMVIYARVSRESGDSKRNKTASPIRGGWHIQLAGTEHQDLMNEDGVRVMRSGGRGARTFSDIFEILEFYELRENFRTAVMGGKNPRGAIIYDPARGNGIHFVSVAKTSEECERGTDFVYRFCGSWTPDSLASAQRGEYGWYGQAGFCGYDFGKEVSGEGNFREERLFLPLKNMVYKNGVDDETMRLLIWETMRAC